MSKNFLSPISVRFKNCVRANWGALFIVAFVLPLVVVAVSLSMGSAGLVDSVSVYAFYVLAIGVFLRLACFPKCRKRNKETV